ncbi:hypothetical protein [Microvirga yunnanensis]|uniref:hypothetical protein n=1 Tax=Microvirga yunnanensis TaxID=2953740 RepID=UPI0021C82353|nr:hypothetical protein [Microvirga sp. HBU65207]
MTKIHRTRDKAFVAQDPKPELRPLGSAAWYLKLIWNHPMTEVHQQIEDLEAEINSLSDAAEQCRKGMVVAKVAVGGGIVLFAASLLGLIRPDAIVLVVGIAAGLAGIAFYGSSRGSLERLTGDIRALEARRAEMIDAIDLTAVGGVKTV